LLLCEVCGFDFAAVYGKLGEGFAECHHRLPLAEYDAEAPTLLEDLAIVCANCHRMLHRSRPMMKVEDLRSLILQRRAER
jgi:5-methylcytosine-specific restriction protein A